MVSRKSCHVPKAINILTNIFLCFFYDFIFYVRPHLLQEYIKEWLMYCHKLKIRLNSHCRPLNSFYTFYVKVLVYDYVT